VKVVHPGLVDALDHQTQRGIVRLVVAGAPAMAARSASAVTSTVTRAQKASRPLLLSAKDPADAFVADVRVDCKNRRAGPGMQPDAHPASCSISTACHLKTSASTS